MIHFDLSHMHRVCPEEDGFEQGSYESQCRCRSHSVRRTTKGALQQDLGRDFIEGCDGVRHRHITQVVEDGDHERDVEGTASLPLSLVVERHLCADVFKQLLHTAWVCAKPKLYKLCLQRIRKRSQ